jgi:hypothetical protein
LTFIGTGAKDRTSVWGVDAPIVTRHVVLPLASLVDCGAADCSFLSAASPSSSHCFFSV